MRILAIRGANLTSLAGEFEVDFEKAPLDRAGIFAITGPTGSGKTTLLDAMCLALFDRTPRFRDRGGVGIGRSDLAEADRLLSNDVRNLLRKGAAAGYAEVAFLGRDGRRWLSRWEVKRARGRSDGRLQGQSLTLTDGATNQLVGRTKKEVLHEIEERLGLSFDQFCRSVLLAQGEFAAFLLAREDERAELLERMTGTQIYAEVSRRCHERAARERSQLAALHERQQGVSVLSTEERKQLEFAATEVERSVLARRADLTSAETAIAWHGALADLEASLVSAEADLGRARVADTELEPVAAGLAEIERARSCSDVLRRHDETLESNRNREVQLAAATAAARQATVTRDDATKSLAAAKQTLDTAHTTRVAAARRERDDVARWLAEHVPVAVLADGWPRWQEALVRSCLAIDAIAAAAPELATGEVERESAAKQLATIATAITNHEADRDRVATELRMVSTQIEAHPVGAAHQLQAMAVGRLTTLKAALERGERIVEGRQREQAAKDRETAATTRAAEAELAADSARKTAEELKQNIAAIAEKLDEARGFTDLHSHRVKLRRGRPCPLCGSTEHPAKQRNLPFPTDVDALARDLTTLQQFEIDTVTAYTEARERAAAGRNEATEATRERRHAAATRASEEERYQADLAAIGDAKWTTSPERPADLEPLRSRIDSAEAEVVPLRAATRQAEELQVAAERWRRELDDVQAKLDRTRRSYDSTQAGLAEADRKLVGLKAAIGGHRKNLEDALESLADAFPGEPDWQSGLLAAPSGFVERARRSCDEFLARRRQFGELEARLVTVERDAIAAELVDRSHANVATTRAAARKAVADKVAAFEAGSAKLVESRSTAASQSTLDDAVAIAESRLKEAERSHHGADRAAAVADSRRDEAAKASDEKRIAQDEAARELGSALARLAMEEHRLRILLAHDETWIAERRRDLDAVRQRVRDARTLVDERERVRRQHEERGRPLIDRQAAVIARAEAEIELRSAEELLAEHKNGIASDNERRRRMVELVDESSRQASVVELWDRLDTLIGSADGKKLRVFAQSLTLESLLDLANEHLSDLAPRYRLQRVPTADLELQLVDCDMGEEVRGANSLSGGETFLVSLALALGLSSLASRDTRIESLFIDEGFGSLDTRSLDQAISVLDSLQASGTKVGLISHVNGLAERIGVQVKLTSCGGGRSKLEVLGARCHQTTAYDTHR